MAAVGRGGSAKVGPNEGEAAVLAEKQPNTLQTLDRGLHALTVVSQNEDGLTVADLSERLGVHRAICYRLVTTLEAHGFLSRGADGRIRLGAGIMTLASRFEPQLRWVAQPLLRRLAEETGAAAFVSVPQGAGCVAIMVAEPEEGVLRVAYRIGSRHPLSLGAAGIAILAGRSARPDDPGLVREARANGFSVTRGQVQQGTVGVASPVHGSSPKPLGFEASVGVVALGDLDVGRAAAAVVACARELAASIGAPGRTLVRE